jgi:derlin-1
MDGMILSVMYIWCQLNKETIMQFWFGMQFKAMYMPWVILLFNWIMSGSYVKYYFAYSI